MGPEHATAGKVGQFLSLIQHRRPPAPRPLLALELPSQRCNRASAIDYATFLDLFFPIPP